MDRGRAAREPRRMPSPRSALVFTLAAAATAVVLLSAMTRLVAVVLTPLGGVAGVRLEHLWRTELRPAARYWWGRMRAPG